MLYLRLLVAALFASVRARRDLVLENLALRHQLAVYTRGRRRPRLRRHDRRLWSLLARGWSGWRGTLVMVEPDTVVRWHRSAWRAYWRWKSRRRIGRPPWEGASVSSGLGSAGASIGHHASVNDVRESAFEAAQRLVPTLASGEFATEVAVAFGARHARLGERRDVERPVQLAVSTAAEAMALDLPARHLKRRRPRVAGVARARGSD